MTTEAPTVPNVEGFLAVLEALDETLYDGTNPYACIVGLPTRHALYPQFVTWLKATAHESYPRRPDDDASYPSQVVFMAEYFCLPYEDVFNVWWMTGRPVFCEDLGLARRAARRILEHRTFTYRPLEFSEESGYRYFRVDGPAIESDLAPWCGFLLLGDTEVPGTHIARTTPGMPRAYELDLDELRSKP